MKFWLGYILCERRSEYTDSVVVTGVGGAPDQSPGLRCSLIRDAYYAHILLMRILMPDTDADTDILPDTDADTDAGY